MILLQNDYAAARNRAARAAGGRFGFRPGAAGA
jgi:hypothetical protein